MKEVPIWEKSNLTLEEAAAYSGIGINKLREMSDSKDCTFVLWNGTKRLAETAAGWLNTLTLIFFDLTIKRSRQLKAPRRYGMIKL